MITGITYTSPSGVSYVIPQSRILRIEGLSETPYRRSASQFAGSRGGTHNTLLMDARGVNIEWLVMEASMAEYIAEREEVFNAFNPDECINGEVGELEIEVNHADNYLLYCIPIRSPRVPERAAEFPMAEAQVQLMADDPVIYSADAEVSSGVSAPAGGGATFPLIFPITFEQTTSGQVTLVNDGNVDTYPVISLSGVLTNPLIRNTTTGDVFQLTYTTDADDTVEIDMEARTVVLNGSTNLITAVVTGSDWWALRKGSNVINLATGSTSDNGTMAINYRHAWNAV